MTQNSRTGQAPTFDLAQLADTLLMRTTLGLVLLGTGHALTVAAVWFGPEAQESFRWVRLTLAGCILLLVLPAVLRFAVARRRTACSRASCDGYLLDVFRRACVAAFTTTFLVLVALEIAVNQLPPSVDSHVILNALLTVTLWMLAGSFFAQTIGDRSPDQL
ncbi:MAG: hypothetical protein AAGA68_15490 [Pseudomonadota bacterium]